MTKAQTQRIAVVGAGNVGAPIAGRLAAAGHNVVLGGPDPSSETIRGAMSAWPNLRAATTADAVADADAVFLAIPFPAAASVLSEIGDALAGKILVDCTNPVGPGLSHGLESQRSGAEVIQAAAPDARVVKAFTIYGFENLQDSTYPGYGDLRPAMLIAGDDQDAKRTVSGFCEELGFEPVDTGPLSSSLHLEHLTLLWIKMARIHHPNPNLVWARLKRGHSAPPKT
ncbi:MAG: NADPH-dependent F420 reductase [Myxococcota bacterium]